MELTIYQHLLVALATALQASIAVVMCVRKLHKKLPFFFAYTVFHLVGEVAMKLGQHGSRQTYFYTYWTLEILDSVVSLLVIREIFVVALAEYEALQELGRLLFRWGVVVMTAVAMLSAYAEPGADAFRLDAALAVMSRSVNLVEMSLLLMLFLFCRWFGLSWRDHVFGIALGFGVMAGLVVFTSTIRTHVGEAAIKAYEYAAGISYNCAVLIWAVYVLLPERQHVAKSAGRLDHLRDWNRALVYLTRR